MKAPRACLRALALLLCAPLAGAATYRLDDSASLPREASALLEWRSMAPSRDGEDSLIGTVAILLRLDVAAWQNRIGRVFLVVPEQPAPLVRMSWRTQGRLQPGQAVPGQRVLIYEGPISTPWLEERIELSIEARSEGLEAMQRLNFNFEIDVD